jgi:hypothetical protein
MNASMSFVEAAAHVLRDANRPLHYKEITERAIAQNLLARTGRAPELTMKQRLTAAVKGGAPVSEMEPGVFRALARDWDGKGPSMPEAYDPETDEDDRDASGGKSTALPPLTTTGHIVRMELLRERLYNYGRRVNKPLYDDGYLIKGALCGAMGDEYRPVPYSIEPERGGTVPILAYSKYSADELRKRIETFGDPEAMAIIDLKTLFSKPIPEEYPEDVGFDVRIWPYISSALGLPRERDRGRTVPSPPAPPVLRRERRVRARSIDYFEHASIINPAITREEAYAEWLMKRFEDSGAEIVDVQMIKFERIPACRDNHMVRFAAPRMQGILHIHDQKVFHQFLQVGASRQKFAGFGMVKILALR